MPDMLYVMALVVVGYVLAGLINMIKSRDVSQVFLYAIVAIIIILIAFLVGGVLSGSGWSGFIRTSDSPYLILLFTMTIGFFGAILSKQVSAYYKTKLGFLFAIGTIALITSVGLMAGLLAEKFWPGLPARMIENKWLDLKPSVFFENLTTGLPVGLVIGIIFGWGGNWIIHRRKQAALPEARSEAPGSAGPPTAPPPPAG